MPVGRRQFIRPAFVVLLMWLTTTIGAFGQSTFEPIRILDISHGDQNVSIQWSGGFPPYRMRVNNGSTSNWVELPQFINSTSFTAVAIAPVSLFQVRTEFEPLRLTGIYQDSEFVRLQWHGGIPPYKVEACDGIRTNWIQLPRLVMEDFYTTPSTSEFRFYRVRVERDTNAPSTPENLTLLTAECDRIVLGWDPATDPAPGSGMKAHNLYRNGQIVKQIPVTAAFVLDSDLVPGHSYEYSLTAIDRAGNESGPSAPLVITTPQCSVTGTNTGGVTLVWDPSEEPGVVGYIVHWGRDPGVYPWQIDMMQATQTAITDLESGVPYFFAITAYDMDGAESEPSAVVAYIPP
jgi:Fibronectin type III domain